MLTDSLVNKNLPLVTKELLWRKDGRIGAARTAGWPNRSVNLSTGHSSIMQRREGRKVTRPGDFAAIWPSNRSAAGAGGACGRWLLAERPPVAGRGGPV